MYQFTLFVDAGSLLRWVLSKSDEMDVEQVATIFLQMWLEVKGMFLFFPIISHC